MIKKNFYVIITMLAVFAIRNVMYGHSKPNFYQTYIPLHDTVYPWINKHSLKSREINNHCTVLDGFYNKFGIVISNYYVIKDSLKLRQKNGYSDNILILSPILLEEKKDSCLSSIDKAPERVLVEVVNIDGKSKLLDVYHNLLSNSGGAISHYNGLYKTSKGFKIVHEAGERYSWNYTVEFEKIRDKLFLNLIDKSCSFNGKTKNVKLHYFKPANEFNITDTLNNQCNCNKFWSQLDQ